VIRAHIHSGWTVSPDSITVSIVMHPPEGSMDVRPRILRLPGADNPYAVSWDEIEQDGSTVEPTMRLDNGTARALLDALASHYEGAEDTRALRRDYDAERKRVDKLADAVVSIAKELAAPGGIA
jgi:hypothetical protein